MRHPREQLCALLVAAATFSACGGETNAGSSGTGRGGDPGGAGGTSGVAEDGGEEDCVPCSAYRARTACAPAGKCVIEACDPGYGDCNQDPSDGCEVDLRWGECELNCATIPENMDCDGEKANGCETNVQEDAKNCGACGKVCALPHSNPSCAMGICQTECSSPGWADCNGILSDGCETNITGDP